MNIFESSFNGNLDVMQELLDSNPELLNASLELSDESTTIKITPLFLAAIAGQVQAVKELLERGTPPRLERGEEDLFTWTCLCPNIEARGKVLDLIFEDDYRTTIHEDLLPIYKKISQGKQDPKDNQEIAEASDSGYPLSPYNAAILSGTQANFYTSAKEPLLIYSSRFRGMSSLELATYRVAVHHLLKNNGFDQTGFDDDSLELLVAVQLGDLEAIKSMHEKGVNVNEPFTAGNKTPTCIAAENGQVEVLKVLKEFGVDLSSPLGSGTVQGFTPALFAARNGHVEVLKYLKECGVDLSSPLADGPNKGFTPAYTAAEMGHVEVLKYLKECGVDFSSPLADGPDKGTTPAFLAAQMGHVEVLKYLNECGVDPSRPLADGANKGVTLACIAAKKGQVEVLKYLKEREIDLSLPLASGRWQGLTPAFVAAHMGKVEVLKYLKECGVDLSSPLADGPYQSHTPAYIAAEMGHVKVLKVLKECGVDLSRPLDSGPFQGETPAYIAARNGHIEVLKYLNEVYDVDLSEPLTDGPNKGKTPASDAAGNGQVEVLKYLKECGVDFSSPLADGPNQGETPAYTAAKKGQVEVLKYLNECDVDLSEPLASGRLQGVTPAYVAAEKGHVEMLKYLNECDVDPSRPLADGPNKGVTLACIAAHMGHVEVLKYLKECDVDLSLPIGSGQFQGLTAAFAAAERGHVEALKFLKECDVDLSSPLDSGSAQGVTPALIAAHMGHVEVFKVLKECGVDLSKPHFVFRGIDLSKPFERYSLEEKNRSALVVYLKNKLGVDIQKQVELGCFQGITPAYVAAANGNVEVLIYLGLDPSDRDLINTFRSIKSVHGFAISSISFSCSPLHIACLLKREDEVQALINYGIKSKIRLKEKAEDCNQNTWDVLDFLFQKKSNRSAVLSDIEQKQIRILNILIDNGWNYSEVMDRLKTINPKLYNVCLSDIENTLKEILLEKKFLLHVLAKSKILTKSGYILWSQGEETYQIDQQNLSDWLRGSIDRLLSKDELPPQKIHFSIKNKFSDIITQQFSIFKNAPIEMSEEKCKRLCLLIEAIEKVSSKLGALEMKSELFIKTQDPPKLRWVAEGETPTHSHDEGKRKKSDSEGSSKRSNKTT